MTPVDVPTFERMGPGGTPLRIKVASIAVLVRFDAGQIGDLGRDRYAGIFEPLP
jgi:hypothetical protein